jgi:hypothetical protein
MTSYKGTRHGSGYGYHRTRKQPTSHAKRRKKKTAPELFTLETVREKKVLGIIPIEKKTEKTTSSHVPNSIANGDKTSLGVNVGNQAVNVGVTGSKENKREMTFSNRSIANFENKKKKKPKGMEYV